MFLKQKYAGLVFGFGLGNFITGTQIGYLNCRNAVLARASNRVQDIGVQWRERDSVRFTLKTPKSSIEIA